MNNSRQTWTRRVFLQQAGKSGHDYYSVLKFFTGFATEALYVLDKIVRKPISNKNKKQSSKEPTPNGTLLAKFCRNI